MADTNRPIAVAPLEAALDLLLDGLEQVAAETILLEQALGAIAADAVSFGHGLPLADEAALDGFAFAAADIAGASAYSPLTLASEPPWVEVGGAMPPGCDCVLDAGLVEKRGQIVEVFGEASPGQGMRRAGEDLPAEFSARQGIPLSPLDLLAARRRGLTTFDIRCPRVGLVDVGSDSHRPTAAFIAEWMAGESVKVTRRKGTARDQGSIGAAIDRALGEARCDLLVLVGGTGRGEADHTADAIRQRTDGMLHGIALRPGTSAVVARIHGRPVLGLPGMPGEAVAAALALVRPVLDRLSGRAERATLRLPLAAKIASAGGFAEIALLRRLEGTLLPIATGAFSLGSLCRAEAFLLVPGTSEGYPTGTTVAALPLSSA